MSVRLSAASLCLALGLTGCDALCEHGIGGSCPPCAPVGVPEAWQDPLLQPLLPGDDAVVCEAEGDESGTVRISYWVTTRVHETNLATVGAAQEAGWARLEDNWYEDDDTSQMAKWSRLGLARGDRMRIDVKAEGKGSRVVIAVQGVPPPPSLRGDVTVFAYRQGSFALFDGSVAFLPDVSGGIAAATADGFLFRTGPGHYARYDGDGAVTDLAPFPTADDGGILNTQGRGPRGMPWVSYNPSSDAAPLMLGELVGEAWDIEMVPDLQPPLPHDTVDAVHSADGTIWLLSGQVLYAKDAQGWHATALATKTSPLRPLAAEANAALLSTEHAVVRVTLEEGRFAFAPLTRHDEYAELYDAGPLGVAARTRETIVLVRGDEVTNTELPGEAQAPDIATNGQGVIAVATKDPPSVLVRDASGEITRHPAQGRVFSMSVDEMGRVWTLMVEGDPFVADGDHTVPLEGLVGQDLRPSSITFMGNGAPPFLSVRAAG